MSTPSTSPTTPEPDQVRRQLETVLRSALFTRSPRLSAFLRFIVESTLEGRSGSLKEAVLARELYGRDEAFNAADDPAVRVDARRLRDKLREYYAENQADPIVISLPKGTYAPSFELRSPTRSDERPSLPDSRTRQWLRWAPALSLIPIAGLFYSLGTPPPKLPLEYRLLTSLPGPETGPSLSPDGNSVAFAWIPPGDPSNQDVYVKAIDGDHVVRLTTNPASDGAPAWSPDGRTIAFIRHDDARDADEGVFLVSQHGGVERQVASSGSMVCWTPDSKALAIRDRDEGSRTALFLISLDTLHRRRLTRPQEGVGDFRCSISPDGETLAFIRFSSPGIGDIWLAPMRGGEPHRLTNWGKQISGLAWAPDGKEIVYDVAETNGRRLWRIAANIAGPARGARIMDGLTQGTLPSFSRPGSGRPARLAFQVATLQIGLYVVDLQKRGPNGEVVVGDRFCPSSRGDSYGVWSPDGGAHSVPLQSFRLLGALDCGQGLFESHATEPFQRTAANSPARLVARRFSDCLRLGRRREFRYLGDRNQRRTTAPDYQHPCH